MNELLTICSDVFTVVVGFLDLASLESFRHTNFKISNYLKRYPRKLSKLNFCSYLTNKRMISWARYNNCKFNPRDVIKNASQFGNLEVLQWLYSIKNEEHIYCCWFWQEICNTAAKYGQLDILIWAKN